MMRRTIIAILAGLALAGGIACSQAAWTGARAGLEGGGAWSGGPEGAAAAPQARSLILFIGDGMGCEMLSVAQVYSRTTGQPDLNVAALANTGGAGFVTTYSDNKLVTDSAAGATALATGVKTNNGMVGTAPDGSRLANLFEKAVLGGKSVGVVTTTSITDATPAGFLAHAAARGNEAEIASQIISGDAVVVMGGGKNFFLPPDAGKRQDGRDLVEEARARGFEVVFDRDGLRARTGKRLLGLFAPDDVPYVKDRVAYQTPSLAEMFTESLRMLTGDPDGFVLVVEGGRIDHAEHDNDLAAALDEFFAFDSTLGLAMEYQASDSSLTIVVTADHSTGGPAMTAQGYSGYPQVSEAAGLRTGQAGLIKWLSEDHVGSMVPVFARGPGAYLFSGIRDNTYINHAMVTILGL